MVFSLKKIQGVFISFHRQYCIFPRAHRTRVSFRVHSVYILFNALNPTYLISSKSKNVTICCLFQFLQKKKEKRKKKERKTLFSEVYAITARSFVVCCLCMCNDVTVRHRKTFLNDREFLNMVSIFYSVLCHFPLDIPYQWRG